MFVFSLTSECVYRDFQVWSMGVIIWQMLTLQPVPYAETGLVALMDGVRDGTLDLRSTLPRSTSWCLLSALAYQFLDPDPSLRPSCSRAMQALDEQCRDSRLTFHSEVATEISQPLLTMQMDAAIAAEDGAAPARPQPVRQGVNDSQSHMDHTIPV
jgi:hypothetical protein